MVFPRVGVGVACTWFCPSVVSLMRRPRSCTHPQRVYVVVQVLTAVLHWTRYTRTTESRTFFLRHLTLPETSRERKLRHPKNSGDTRTTSRHSQCSQKRQFKGITLGKSIDAKSMRRAVPERDSFSDLSALLRMKFYADTRSGLPFFIALSGDSSQFSNHKMRKMEEQRRTVRRKKDNQRENKHPSGRKKKWSRKKDKVHVMSLMICLSEAIGVSIMTRTVFCPGEPPHAMCRSARVGPPASARPPLREHGKYKV